MDEMIDTHLYPHGTYAMGALENLSNVIVYFLEGTRIIKGCKTHQPTHRTCVHA